MRFGILGASMLVGAALVLAAADARAGHFPPRTDLMQVSSVFTDDDDASNTWYMRAGPCCQTGSYGTTSFVRKRSSWASGSG